MSHHNRNHNDGATETVDVSETSTDAKLAKLMEHKYADVSKKDATESIPVTAAMISLIISAKLTSAQRKAAIAKAKVSDRPLPPPNNAYILRIGLPVWELTEGGARVLRDTTGALVRATYAFVCGLFLPDATKPTLETTGGGRFYSQIVPANILGGKPEVARRMRAKLLELNPELTFHVVRDDAGKVARAFVTGYKQSTKEKLQRELDKTTAAFFGWTLVDVTSSSAPSADEIVD